MKNMMLPLFLIAAGIVLLCSVPSDKTAINQNETQSAEMTVPVLSVSGNPATDTIRVLLKNNNSIYHDKLMTDTYPGKLECYETAEGYVYVNEVTLNDYLAGVLFQEMPASFCDEALKAQVVCARSYALSHMESYAYPEFLANLDDSVSYQVYAGAVNERAKKLVEATGNTVLTYEESIVNAYFYSTSCGITGDGNVWQRTVPYLTSVLVSDDSGLGADYSKEEEFKKLLRAADSFYEKGSPWFRWRVRYASGLLLEQLREQYGHEATQIVSVIVENRLACGLVAALAIETDRGTVRVEGQNEIRSLFADAEVVRGDGELQTLSMLPSAYFVLQKEGDALVFDGGGFGHGAGLSQYGADALGKEGYGWQEILQFFFPKCEIRQLKGGNE